VVARYEPNVLVYHLFFLLVATMRIWHGAALITNLKV
jgi:hypothetical protein